MSFSVIVSNIEVFFLICKMETKPNRIKKNVPIHEVTIIYDLFCFLRLTFWISLYRRLEITLLSANQHTEHYVVVVYSCVF